MIYQKVVDYCKDHDMSIMAFEQLCGLANGVVGKWKDDEMNPSLSSLTRIAEATGIPIAEWLEANKHD